MAEYPDAMSLPVITVEKAEELVREGGALPAIFDLQTDDVTMTFCDGTDNVPEAPWYAVSTDLFMSGGRPLSGVVRHVFLCQTKDAALVVAHNLTHISGQHDVQVLQDLNGLEDEASWWNVHTPKTTSNWYRRGYWRVIDTDDLPTITWH